MISWPYLTFVTRGWSSLLLNATCAWIGSIVPIVSVLLFIKSRQYSNGCCLLSAHVIYVQAWGPNIIVMESVATEGGVAAEQLREYGLPIHSVKPFADKQTRFSVHSGRYQRGEIHHNEMLDPELEGQCVAYPHVRHDDAFDSLTYALAGFDSKAWALLSSGRLSVGKRVGLA